MTEKKPATLDEAHDLAKDCAERCEKIAEHVQTARDRLDQTEKLLASWPEAAAARLRQSTDYHSKADVQAEADHFRELILAAVADLDKKVDALQAGLEVLECEATDLRNEIEEAKQ